MVPVLEAVPNVSEGRDAALLDEMRSAVSRAGVEVWDASADPDHNRSVLTFAGDPGAVEAASLDLARLVLERVDLRAHRGVHPRVGALDVLPFVPLSGLDGSDAVASARRVARSLAEDVGVPAYLYGLASDPPGRGLAELRRGGFEALADGFPPGREPDEPVDGLSGPHPTAGVTCVGARRLLLAWNVYVEGVDMEALRALAGELREAGGGFESLRALALELRTRGRLQVSMNLEDLDRTSAFDVFRAIERRVEGLGGAVTGTEVIGMIPDALVLPASADRLHLLGVHRSRLLSARLARHVSLRAAHEAASLRAAVLEAGDLVPAGVRSAAHRLARSLSVMPESGDDS